jgi:hypothetical protein
MISGAGALLIGLRPTPFLIVLFGRGGGSIVKRRSSTNTSATATSFGVTVIVVEFPFVVLWSFAGKGLPTTFLALFASEGFTMFGERFVGAAFFAGTFLATAFLAGAFLATFLTAFFAGAFLVAFLATFFAAVFFGTVPPVCCKSIEFARF